MSLTANPPTNNTSAFNPRGGASGSQKSFQNFVSVQPTAQTALPTNQNYASAYIINTGTGKTNMDALLAANGVPNFGFTAYVVSLGNHEIWATRTAVPTSGLCPGTTWFQIIFFDGNELTSAGSLTQGAASGGPFFAVSLVEKLRSII